MSTASMTNTTEAAKATLLFVDDEPNIISALQRLFRPQGYRIFTATSGSEGLEIMAREQVDLVISDMRMPQMDGAAFLEQVAGRWPQTVRILLTGYADLQSAVAAINKGGIYRYLSKPWEDNDIRNTVSDALEKLQLKATVERQNAELKDLNTNLEAKVKARTEEVRQVLGQLEVTHEELKKTYATSVKMFSSLIELRQQQVLGHASRVSEHVQQLMPRLRIGDVEAQQLNFAALLHDIGKIGFPDRLLTTPYEQLTPAEREQFHTHPVVGQTALMPLESLQEAARCIRGHREYLDGSGYPDGLKGDAISLASRVLCAVVDHDAQLHGLLTGKRLSSKEAQDWLIANKGKRYDPRVVEVFLDILRQPPVATDMPIESDKLKPGMLLARDLLSTRGMLLLSKGRQMTDAIISKIQALEKQEGGRFIIHVLKK